ncbi:Protein JINGUBANG [Camellia lanceoleosa]|uniref:Protein JINGUBANG n=1 Tax=Camellia lanceoleosa TaxID=1840588 RepID=A0ACC0FWH1_9ERIC|nr:Protein JINGUBANG [Camellia lanceoleosa]
MGSLVREEGHIYSLATSGDLLYTGSDRKNIRVWKTHKEFFGFKLNNSLSEDKSLLYSASWDKTMKVLRVSNSKFLESIHVHDNVVNAVVAKFDGLVFTGSADENVKIWWREM